MFYLVFDAALKPQAGDRGLVCSRDPGGGAGVPQVVLIDLTLSGPHDQTRPIRKEVYSRQRTLRSERTHQTKEQYGLINSKGNVHIM